MNYAQELQAFEQSQEVAPQGAAPVAPVQQPQQSFADQLASFAEQPKDQQVADIPAAPNDPDSVGSTVGRSVDRLQAAYGGTAEAVGEAAGLEGLTDWGKQTREAQLLEASQYGEPTVPQSIKDVDDLGDFGSYLKDMGIKSLAPMSTIGAGTLAGATAGARVAPGGGLGKAIGGFVGGFLGAFGMEVGEIQNGIKAADPDAVSPWSALAGGTFNAALDAGGASYLLKLPIAMIGEKAVVNGLVKQGLAEEVAKGVVKTAAVEGGIGAVQSVAGDASVAQGTGQDMAEDWLWNALDGAIGGAALGGTLGGGLKAHETIANNNRVAGSEVVSAKEELAAMPTPTTPAEVARFTELTEKVAKDTAKASEPQSLSGKLWSTFGGTSLDPIKGLAEVSPSARQLVEDFRPDMTGKTASDRTIFEDRDLMAGKWRSETNNILEGKSEAELSRLFDEVSQPSAALVSPEAVALRQTLDDVHDTAVSAGMDTIGYVEGHLPVRLDRDKILADRPAFEAELVAAGRAPQDATQAVNDWLVKTDPAIEQDTFPKINRDVQIDPVTGQTIINPSARLDPNDPDSKRYKMGQTEVTPEFGHLEKSRAFAELPQTTLNKWAKEQTGKEKAHAVKDYFEGAAHRIAYTTRYGRTGDLANGMIAKAIKESQDAGRRVDKMEVDRMYDILDAYNGLQGRIKDARLRKAQSTVGAVMTIATLPLSALSSLVEVTVPAIRGDIQAAVASAGPAMAQMARDFKNTLLKGAQKTEFAQIAAEANITFEAATSVANERLGANMFTRGAAKATRGFFILNGLSLITHMTRTYAAKTGDYIYQRNIQELASGLPFTSAQGRHRLNQLRSMGVDVQNTAHAVSLYSPSNLSQVKDARDLRVLAIKRFTDQSVLDPNIGSTPLWMNEGRFQTIAMLKRYPAAFGNTILPQLARRFSTEYAGNTSRAVSGAVGSAYILGMMIGIGYIQDELKQVMKGVGADLVDTRTDGQRFADIAAQTIMPLQASILLDSLYNAPRYGTNSVMSAMGPVAGLVADATGAAGKTIQSFADDPTAGHAVKFLFKASPFKSFQAAKDIISSMEE